MRTLALALGLLVAAAATPSHAVINGSVVEREAFPEIVRLQARRSSCTGTIIGPQAILTAAHCAKDGGARIRHGGEWYTASYAVSRDHKSRRHDLAVAITDRALAGASLATVATTRVRPGETLELFGYGCVEPGGKGSRGQLLFGPSVVRGLTSLAIVTKKRGGGALCYGDSGGPAFVRRGDQRLLVGVHAAGNIRDTNVHTRLDAPLSRAFLRRVARRFNVDLCGVTAACPVPGLPQS